MRIEDADSRWMRRALRLAERGFTPPNPMVGCVIVLDGAMVGEGYHLAAGMPHAEVMALNAAGEGARGADVYVTLEPCSHFGRTPPCTDALIRAGVKRVVAATLDSDPRVRGSGIARLKEAGIEARAGLMEEQARSVNRAFFHFHECGTPYVTMKAAMTLDGKTATRSGDTKWITGKKARREVHRLRARSGAVLAGVGSVLADNPRLDARLPGIHLPRQPLRIIADSQLRTPPESEAVILARTRPDKYPLLIAASLTADKDAEDALTLPGVEIVRLPQDTFGRVNLRSLMELLTERQIISVLVEGGPTLNEALMRSCAVHQVMFFIAPVLVGGRDALTALEGEGISRLGEAWRLGRMKTYRFGSDIAIMADVLNSDK